ncbi:SIMPL domain-containing protein [Nocardioides sp.]|uniref:SIMPL domain-containing protein n=1 Tax=Nocardioides sp. TaxID=35761 RepID=UPI003D0CD530
MDGKVTLSVRGILITGLVLLALLAAYLVGASGGASSPAQAAGTTSTSTDRRTISLTGKGEATAVPDQLSFSVAVALTRPDLETALNDSSTAMKKVFAALEDNSVAAKDIQTSGLSMNPVYDYPPYSSPVLVGYRVSQRATVSIDDLKAGGRAIGAAVAAGGNGVKVSNIRLQVSDPDAVLKQARDAAVAQAKAKAEEYAAATGQSLGDVVSLREVSAPAAQSPLWNQRATYDLEAAKAVPIRAGSDDLAVRVQVVWEFS